MDMYMLQSLATPELTLRVVVLIWQALLDALSDHTVIDTCWSQQLLDIVTDHF